MLRNERFSRRSVLCIENRELVICVVRITMCDVVNSLSRVRVDSGLALSHDESKAVNHGIGDTARQPDPR